MKVTVDVQLVDDGVRVAAAAVAIVRAAEGRIVVRVHVVRGAAEVGERDGVAGIDGEIATG